MNFRLGFGLMTFSLAGLASAGTPAPQRYQARITAADLPLERAVALLAAALAPATVRVAGRDCTARFVIDGASSKPDAPATFELRLDSACGEATDALIGRDGALTGLTLYAVGGPDNPAVTGSN